MVLNIDINNLIPLIGKINIIDIRQPLNYNNNHIPGAVNISAKDLKENPSKYLDKNKKYYIYCKKGINSYKICYYLNVLGYNTVNIKGGYESWILGK